MGILAGTACPDISEDAFNRPKWCYAPPTRQFIFLENSGRWGLHCWHENFFWHLFSDDGSESAGVRQIAVRHHLKQNPARGLSRAGMATTDRGRDRGLPSQVTSA
jgi:hypothetical protein